MRLSDFTYPLPERLIAQEQAVPRDSARLMLVNRETGNITHHHVYDLPALLRKALQADLPPFQIVANNTKVFPARLLGHRPTGGKVEILLTQPLGHSRYLCIARPGLKQGDQVIFTGSLQATITQVSDGLERTVQFNQEESALRTTLSEIGTMPTPPYIKKLLGNSADYQTIYAKYGFSAAAPTAGLHFTPDLLKAIKIQHNWLELTLNVGLGTFLPVKEDEIQDHHMHAETYTISPTVSHALSTPNQKTLAIGTTTMRALESNATLTDTPDHRNTGSLEYRSTKILTPGSFSTEIFIYPPYQFKVTDALMTNFHLPGSTLLMLVSAFCSQPNSNEKFTTFEDSLLGRAYSEAIKENYRFFSFGDAMLII